VEKRREIASKIENKKHRKKEFQNPSSCCWCPIKTIMDAALVELADLEKALEGEAINSNQFLQIFLSRKTKPLP
jgi:hypothetical protein